MDNITKSPFTKNPFLFAWLLALLFYFLEYAVRSAPSIMIPGLRDYFDTGNTGVSTVIGAYYITYSVTSLLAGIAIDRLGAKYPLVAGTLLLGIGCAIFTLSGYYTGYTGRLLQGMGSAISFPACVYLAARAFHPKKLATAIGVTQSLGMLGGSAGQFLAAPLLKNGLGITAFWIALGVIAAIIGLLIAVAVPNDASINNNTKKQSILTPYKIIFSNRQSYLCGIVSGLLFAPTTIFAMTWGVAFFQAGRDMDFAAATLACAIIPVGWAIGCPLLGWLSDRLQKRKPVLAGGAILMIIALLQLLYMPGLLPVYVSTLILGIGSGAAMIPYSLIKESNPDNVKGSATGVINFITFGVTSLLGPVFAGMYGNTLAVTNNHESHFISAGLFWVACIALAIVVSLLFKETGSKEK